MSDKTLVLKKQEAVKLHVLGLKEKSHSGTAAKLPISEIVIGERIIPEDPKVVAQLVISIKQIGQTTPILTRQGPDGRQILVDGLNRIAALKQLGEVEVLTTVLDVSSDLDAKACEAFSNSHRRQKLTALVLTVGNHFRAMSNKLSERFPNADIVGIFVARRAIPHENFDDFGDLDSEDA